MMRLCLSYHKRKYCAYDQAGRYWDHVILFLYGPIFALLFRIRTGFSSNCQGRIVVAVRASIRLTPEGPLYLYRLPFGM